MHRSIAPLLAIMLILTACGGTGSSPTEAPLSESSGLDTPQAFVNALDAAMKREGEVLHMTMTSEGGEAGQPTKQLLTREIWIDGVDDVARHTLQRAPGNGDELPEDALYITRDGRTYDRLSDNEIDVRDRPARTCPLVEESSTVRVVTGLFCARYTPQEGEVEELSASVDIEAEFDGVPAAALAYTARNELDVNATPAPEELPALIVSTYYIDRETMLALGWTVEYSSAEDDPDVTITGRYESEFIDRAKLPADFFAPAMMLDPQPRTPIYWLGSAFDPEGDLPLMVPRGLDGPHEVAQPPTFEVILSYSPPFGTEQWATEISVQHWTADNWSQAIDDDRIARDLWLFPCASSRTIDLDEGDATIFLTYEPEPNGPLAGDEGNCPDYEPDRFIGIVHLSDTVLLINGPYGNELHPRSLGDESYDPYDSLEGLRAIIEGLQLFTEPEQPTAATEIPTLNEIYVRLAEMLEREGAILHSTQDTEIEITGLMSGETTIEQWVAPETPVARIELTGRVKYVEPDMLREGSSQIIVRDGSEYSTSRGDFGQPDPRAVEAKGCYGQPQAIAIIIGCPGPTEDWTTSIAWGVHEGQSALLLVTEGTSRGSDEVSTFTRHTYLDPDTYLPRFSEQAGTFNIGTFHDETRTTTYEHEFVERTSLPDDFFELSAIGYTEPG